MSEKDISLLVVRNRFSYNENDGVLRWAAPTNRRVKQGSQAGSLRADGYLEVEVDGVRARVHRVIWFFVHGKWPSNDIDHMNGIRSDNRLCNLRDVTRSVNLQNQRHPRGRVNANSLIGAAWLKKEQRWIAAIGVGGKTKFIGQFKTEEEAHRAYVAAKRELHDGCTI